MIRDEKPFHVGSFLVQRVPSSSVRFRIIHDGSWCGYICPETISTQLISELGKLIEVTSRQHLIREREAYRAEIDPAIEAQFAYYELTVRANDAPSSRRM